MLVGLTPERSRAIEDVLLDFLVKAEAEATVLCDKGGNIIAEYAVADLGCTPNMAALSAGSFFATREIATMIGEPEFRQVFHEGGRKGLYMQLTGTDHLLVVVFGERTNPGLVKLFGEETAALLDQCLKEAESDSLNERFGEIALPSQEEAKPLFGGAASG